MPRLEQRVGDLEQRPPALPPELGEMRQQIAAVSAGISDLTTRLEQLANSVQGQSAGASDLATRLERLDQVQQAQAADLAAKLDPLQQGLRAQESAAAELGSRMQGLEKATRSRAGDLTDMGLTLALLQIHNAVETGRPFPAEYETLSSLARARPEIAAAAAPLAAAAPTGTADRAALAQELRAVAQRIDAAPGAVDTGSGWTGAALDRLRGLVRIRRADEAEPGKEAEAAVAVAERALAGGDLARAAGAIEKVQGPAAAEAAEWLRKARARLAVEAAMQRLEALLTGRLGDTAAIPGAPG
ncbi:MAG TPA: mitofilin family membrane protein [Stellaceae bacterium]|nr:mitofilin family membrane protein [Stellaceae bacterium]